jgi:hypothetical protein
MNTNKFKISSIPQLIGSISLFLVIVLLCPKISIAADNSVLTVMPISGQKPGYSLYWDTTQSLAIIERSDNASNFSRIAETPLNYYVDFSVAKDKSYTYRVTVDGKLLSSNASLDLSVGKSVIGDIISEAGVASTNEASVVLKFKTDKLAKNQIFYGESLLYDMQTEVDNSLNQSHTILLEKLKPNTTYHFKVKTTDKNDENVTESDDQLFTTPVAANETTILQIIIKALSEAFAGFESWFRG